MPLPRDNLFYGLAKQMTDEQRTYVNSIIDYNVVFSNSPAGTGKSTMAVAALYYLYECGVIDKVYYVFSPVEERTMGYRPGDQSEKEFDYTMPLHDALAEIGQMPDKAMDEKFGWIQARSHTFMRGINMKRAGVIFEEFQNFTTQQAKKVLTRVHDDCHVVVIGHDGQIDLANPKQSGFVRYLRHFEPYEEHVRVCNLTHNFRGWISTHADNLEEATH